VVPTSIAAVSRTRVAIAGTPEHVSACAPSGPGVEVVPVDAAEAPELVLVFGGGAPPDLPAPAIVWVLEGDEPPAGLRAEDRLVATAPGVEGAWRTMPLPVADELFAPAPGEELAGRAAWLTPDGPRRRLYLDRFSHSVELVDDPAGATVAVNLHDGERASFEPRVARALAAGQLLVSETLEPPFGFEPGIDYLEARDLTDLFVMAENAARAPGVYAAHRARGRRKAEWFRASRVVERLAHDLRVESTDAPAGASL
jgi:hypothetical protein